MPIQKSSSGYRHGQLPMEVGNEDQAPMNYLLKVKSFSQLSELLSETTEKRCESTAFEAGGYKWKLVLYPVGDKERNGDGHISLYLMIVETQTLPHKWTVHAKFKIFVYDYNQDSFRTFEGSNAKVRCFHAVKTELGFPRLLSLGDFKDPSKGFLVGDTCFLGVQVLVQDYIENLECLSMSDSGDKAFSWKIRHFSEHNEEIIESETFIFGGLEWVVRLYPKGFPIATCGGYLSMFLKLKDGTTETKLVCARYSLLIKDQCDSKDLSRAGTASGSSFRNGRGWSQFIPLSRLQNSVNGFLLGDTLIIEAKVDSIFKMQNILSVDDDANI
ncbi:hypothetical protein SLEP1_g21907 [Rubroshorea leprosula]|uniref:MATH domain-containing protein n=1 Tax=Rubroshorea leprosula TaxID=152421 RepID=A0AAV5JGT1_9ROSI|nr:hypothetical protein SLEP1_g21907 [Rubroshorea leprosula]